jgi:hypothetical protein
MKRFVSIIFAIFYSIHGKAQLDGNISRYQEQPNLPKVFMIGEYEKPYENMSVAYEKLLLHIYKDDMNRAFEAWTSVLISMEEYAKEVSFNINGLKLWMNVFFNVDGSIQHIVYFPKPNSRNMEFEHLTNFFTSFCKVYRFPNPIPEKCSHFGSASFPTFAKRN